MSRKNLQLLAMLVFVLSAFVFTGCSKDDGDGETSSSELVGTWKAVSYEAYEASIDQYYSDTDVEYETIIFNSDGTGYIIAWEKNRGESSLNWKLNGDLLTMSIEAFGEDVVWKVVKLTSTEAILDIWYDAGKSGDYQNITYRKVK
ncbi:MAG: lipocalin family protein [Tannerellaceae bacterium]|jgi:hypothetical protein|nr:lipocalin family protein [Tannerellaceae bacterium]